MGVGPDGWWVFTRPVGCFDVASKSTVVVVVVLPVVMNEVCCFGRAGKNVSNVRMRECSVAPNTALLLGTEGG